MKGGSYTRDTPTADPVRVDPNPTPPPTPSVVPTPTPTPTNSPSTVNTEAKT